jgi:alpha-amylase
MGKLIIVASLLAVLLLVEAKTAKEWRSRTIYQIVVDRFSQGGQSGPNCNLSKYCGGTWRGIQNNLDYIQGMGFNAIWISPVVQNTPDGYHGYWAKDFFSVNEHFGSESDLKSLVNACHSRGV